MKVLVTGGAGYIGSMVARRLVDIGNDVTVADNLLRGHRDAVPDAAQFVELDLLDREALDRLISEGFDAIFHFAALSLVAESVAMPTHYMRANVMASLNLLDAMRAHDVRRLVFSSTAAVYGEPESVPITEDARPAPTNPYGASKYTIDTAIGFETASTALGAVSLRYFNVAGASGRLGERHDPETHLIPLVLQTALGCRREVGIFGTDYPTRDGTAVRDYIHLEDLADAHVLAVDAAESPGHRVYNLGNGAGYSVREVVDTARAVTGRPIRTTEEPRRPGDPAVLIASSARIRDELGWTPKKPELATMIHDAWAFVLGTPAT